MGLLKNTNTYIHFLQNAFVHKLDYKWAYQYRWEKLVKKCDTKVLSV